MHLKVINQILVVRLNLKSNLLSNLGTSLKKRTLINHSIKSNYYTQTTDAFLLPQTDETNYFPWLTILKLAYLRD